MFKKFPYFFVILLLLWNSRISAELDKNNSRTKKTLDIPVEPEQMPDYMLRQQKKDPFIKKHFNWKLAYCQHPMYLLIDEDRGIPVVGERVPPWGAKNAKDYVERVERNLKSLEQLPGLKLNYQWSAVELFSMVRDFPKVYERMKKLYQKGSLDFVDGTYSQAHLQVLGSESNWRQFEYGLDIYKKLFNKKVDVYARQETGVHQQLPQLLRNFHYKFATLPYFSAVLEIIKGPFEIHHWGNRFETIAGCEFINAVGLDGSKIPLYILEHADIEDEIQQDLTSGSKMWYEFPDLREIDENKYQDKKQLFDWVLLRDALLERYKQAPPKADAKIYTYWSYTEGLWAEELLRKTHQAEQMAVLAEQIHSMAKLAGLDLNENRQIKQIWETILKTQHHDISWLEVTDLRRKSINRMDKAIEKCINIMKEAAQKITTRDNDYIAVFNGMPKARDTLITIDGKKSLGDETFQAFNGKSLGFVSVPAGGFKSFKTKQNADSSKKNPMPEKIQTSFYGIKLAKNGLIKQITTHKGRELLQCGDYLGGEIKARIDKNWVDNRSANCSFYTGSVCDILERKTKLGKIPLVEHYYFFKNQPFIKAQVEFDFNADTIGYSWIDRTKVNIYYPTKGHTVYHDIPFGYVPARQERSLFAINWLYCGGLVYINTGTTRHWVKDGVIANVAAWGSNHFTNRHHWGAWISRPQYDIRLYGNQKITYYLIPFGDFDGNKITTAVKKIVAPTFKYPGRGEKSFYKVEDENLAITSIYEKDEKIWKRGYKLPTGGSDGLKDWEIFDTPLKKTN